MMQPQLLWIDYLWPVYLFAAVTGLVAGSFCNVVIYRLPRKLGVARGRSFCTDCKHSLGALDLVPLFSWLFLRGRCRYCGARISARYPLVELLGGLGFLAAAVQFGLHGYTLLYGLFYCCLLCVAFIDADTQIIPDRLQLAIAVLGLATALLGGAGWIDRLIGMVCVSVPMALIAWLLGGFGFGDVKLMAAAGFLLGWRLTLVAFGVGVVAGGLYGAIQMARKRLQGKSAIAFGPFLCAGLVFASLLGEPVLRWYSALFH